MIAYPRIWLGIGANIRVIPSLVSVWYFSPLDSNSIICAPAGETASTERTRQRADEIEPIMQ